MAALTSTGLCKWGEVQSSTFSPIYYLGCKREFTPAIKAAIDEVDPSGGRLGDLFAGTGAVGAFLGASREVTTVDVQEYSRVLCSAVLKPQRMSSHEIRKLIASLKNSEKVQRIQWCLEPLIDYEQHCIASAQYGDYAGLIELLESHPLAARETILERQHSRFNDAANRVIERLKEYAVWDSPDTTVSRLFGGVYFSFEQAVMLDAMLTRANSSDFAMRDTLIAATLSTASMLVNTVGKQFAQPLRPKSKSGVVKTGLASVVQRDRSMNALATYELWLRRYLTLLPAVGEARALREGYLDAISKHGPSWSVLYADPPYTRDHYSRFYHVLETMCLRDNPAFSLVTKSGEVEISRGLYRQDRHQSEFCIRSSAPAAFSALFQNARKSNLPLVLSYSPHETGDGTHPRVVSMNLILEIATQHYERVEVSNIDGSTHNLLNRSGLKLKTRAHAEILLKCYR